MIALLTVEQGIVKNLINSLIDYKVDFEFNVAHRSFRIKGVSQWMLLTDKDCYLLSFYPKISSLEIHKGNLEEICIAQE